MAAPLNLHHRHLHFRRGDDILTNTAGSGIAGVTTASTTATGTALAFDPSAKPGSVSAPPLNDSPITVTSNFSTDASTPTDAALSASSHSSVISMGTVIGACLGALAGACFIILVGIWIYKRSAPRKGRPRHPVSPLSATRNARGEADRSRARRESWGRLDEGQDKWERQTKEVILPPSAGIKKPTPSVRTAYTQKSYELPAFELDPHPFSQYHPGLAKELASDPEPPVRQFLDRVDSGPAISWDGDTIGDGSFLSLRSRLSGAMSPSLEMARPTPGVTTQSEPQWESAEVFNFEPETTQSNKDHSNNPFNHVTERRRSESNPFFNAQSTFPQPRSRRSSRSSVKGKEREDSVICDPFADQSIPSIPTLKHVDAEARVSVSSNDRALQQLIAVLDLSAADVQERLRVASMQPSVYSSASVFTEDEDVAHVANSFPLPPGATRQ